MGVLNNLEQLLFTVAGFGIAWLSKILFDWAKDSTERRRREVDAQAATATENRKLKESLHAHRVEMLKSGQWTQDTLPVFMKE